MLITFDGKNYSVTLQWFISDLWGDRTSGTPTEALAFRVGRLWWEQYLCCGTILWSGK